MENIAVGEALLPLALVVAGLVLGVFLEKVVLKRLQHLAVLTRWRADNVIFASLRGMPVMWGVIVGIYVAILTSQADETFIERLETTLAVAVLLSVTIVAARIGAGLIAAYASRDRTFLPATSIIPNLTRLLIYIVGFLIILNELGISITPILGALGVGGLAVALALQDTLANVFAGLYLLAAGQLNPGDYIRLDSGDEGYIIDVNWRSTTVRTITNVLVIVPNSKVASATVTNYSLPRQDMLVRIPVGVDYNSDLEAVERITKEVARDVLREVYGSGKPLAEPMIYYHTFGEFSLNYVVYLRVREYFDQYRVRHLFMKRLLVRFRAEGIKFPFPIREFQMQISTEPLEAEAARRIHPSDAYESSVESDAPAKGLDTSRNR